MTLVVWLQRFLKPGRVPRRTVEIVGDQIERSGVAQIMSRVLRRSVTYSHIPRDTYAALGFPSARDLADMFEFLRVRLLANAWKSHSAGGCIHRCKTFEVWVQANTGGFAAVFGQRRELLRPASRSANHCSPAPSVRRILACGDLGQERRARLFQSRRRQEIFADGLALCAADPLQSYMNESNAWTYRQFKYN